MDAQNPLYPIFLKLHQLRVLIVGGGEVGYEKLFFMLKSSPDANITLVAKAVSPKILDLLAEGRAKNVWVMERAFQPSDILQHDLIIAATNHAPLNSHIHRLAKCQGKLVNVADTPELCDFYLGAIVTRGQLKVAISTNGQSPTFAKRFRQVLEEVLPQDANALLSNLRSIRDRLKGNFSEKVDYLNRLTASLVGEEKLNEHDSSY